MQNLTKKSRAKLIIRCRNISLNVKNCKAVFFIVIFLFSFLLLKMFSVSILGITTLIVAIFSHILMDNVDKQI